MCKNGERTFLLTPFEIRNWHKVVNFACHDFGLSKHHPLSSRRPRGLFWFGAWEVLNLGNSAIPDLLHPFPDLVRPRTHLLYFLGIFGTMNHSNHRRKNVCLLFIYLKNCYPRSKISFMVDKINTRLNNYYIIQLIKPKVYSITNHQCFINCSPNKRFLPVK